MKRKPPKGRRRSRVPARNLAATSEVSAESIERLQRTLHAVALGVAEGTITTAQGNRTLRETKRTLDELEKVLAERRRTTT